MTEARYELPPSIAKFSGQINDVDAHESIPLNRWIEEFGSVATEFVEAIKLSNLIIKTEKDADDAEINDHNVWKLKMEQAPGAFDFDRRLAVMDYTGIHRQLMYPGSLGLFSLSFYTRLEDPKIFSSITGDRRAYARKLIDAYNGWCARLYREQDRLRPVAVLLEESPEEMIATAKKLIGQGIRAFWIPTDRLPGNRSPAHPDLDPLWDVLSAAKAPLLSHVGATEGVLKTMKWRDAPAFQGWKAGNESSFDPWTLSNFHLGAQVFFTTMVLGGVFHRYPDLRFGSAELTGHWVGPMAENMDLWYENIPFKVSVGEKLLKEKPSEYVRRCLRVACFDFEPVGAYIDRFGLEEVYCYASDFPHHEGGVDPMNDFANSLQNQSESTLRKFFIDNGKELLPD